jgi:DNA (cytosine-5)-methyltransferase 1
MRHGSLFSGIGGFDLAAEWMGWENIFHCEWNPFGQKVLKHHFPNSISYNDITKTDFSIHRGEIDILTGGFPCQPYSTAGLRKGKADKRHLFPEMLRAIKEIEPTWVIGENVRGLVSWGGGLVFEEVCSDLEREGYEVQPFLIPAAGVNAPHQRQRIWFVAFKDTNKNGWRGFEWQKEPNEWEQRNISTRNNESIQANNEEIGVVAYSNNKRGSCEFREVQKENGKVSKRNNDAKLSNSNISNVANTISERGQLQIKGKYSIKQVFGSNGKDRKINRWEIFPIKPPICGGNDGIPRELDSITFSKWRNESIKAYGNAIVPQLAHEIFKTIRKFEEIV